MPEAPPFGTAVRGVVPFAGQRIALPAGDWLSLGARVGPLPDGRIGTIALFAQLDGSRLAALMSLSAFASRPGMPTPGFPRFPSCQETRNVYNRVLTAHEGGEQACWSVDAVALASLTDPLLASGALELKQRGAALPEIVARVRFGRANAAHLLFEEIWLPVPTPPEGPEGWAWSGIRASPERMALMTRLRDWCTGWWPLVDRGFAGFLEPNGVPLAYARLPW